MKKNNKKVLTYISILFAIIPFVVLPFFTYNK